MKLLYGTANPAKLQSMKKMLEGLDIELVGLDEVCVTAESVEESGSNPLENARIKALEYYKALGQPVFSCDSGLFIDGLNQEEQPGVHVRRVGGKTLTDEEMIAYYSGIAQRLGGIATARYQNAICLVLDDDNIHVYDGGDISSESFLLSAKAHPRRIQGFPLDSISIEPQTGKYYYDLEDNRSDINSYDIGQGFREFFVRVMPGLKKTDI